MCPLLAIVDHTETGGMIGDVLRSVGLFYLVIVGGGLIVLVAVILAREAFDALRAVGGPRRARVVRATGYAGATARASVTSDAPSSGGAER